MNDALTIENLKARSESAWEKAFQEFVGYGRGVLKNRKKGHNWPFRPEDFEEFIDDGIVALYKNIETIKSLAHARQYFISAVLNAAYTLIREQLTQKRGEGKILTTDSFTGLRGDVSGITLKGETIKVVNTEDAINDTFDRKQEIIAILQDCLEEMSERDRIIINDLVIHEDVKQKEVAEKLGVGVSQIGNLKNQALDRLFQKVKQRLRNEIE
jgi:RNA polymerase sigma factor (sigma-70 family)